MCLLFKFNRQLCISPCGSNSVTNSQKKKNNNNSDPGGPLAKVQKVNCP